MMQQWTVDASAVLMRAASGLPLTIRFAVKVDADQPFGLNILNFSEGHEPPDAWPIEIQVR